MAQVQPKQQNFIAKALIAYLYLVQGLVLSLCVTVPLTYEKLPSYQILGYFSASTLPFSFKFITAPLIQKYSRLSYGRRKLWIVISMSTASLVLYLISKIVEDQNQQILTAFLLFILGLCVSIQDISTDALGIKELRKPQLSSFLQAVFQQIGLVTGSLLLGQMTSERFGQYFGYQGSIISSGQFLLYLIPLIAGPTLWIHLFFKQSSNQKQQIVQRLSLWQVVSHYRHFILPKYRVCRQALLLILMFQGMNFFMAGYSIQLIKSQTLSKQFAISLGNFSLLLIFPATYILSKFINAQNLQKAQRILFTMRVLFVALIFFVDSKEQNFAVFALFFLQLMSSLHFYLNGIVMNSFQDSKFQGMSVTMMASMSNLGRNSTVHLNLIGKFGFGNCVIYSFGYSGVATLILGKFHDWINKGKQQQEEQSCEVHQHSD